MERAGKLCSGHVVDVLVALWFSPVRRFATWVLRVWALLHLVGGGILSVLPLPFLPFDPPQTLYHYTFHVTYASTQVPLVMIGHNARSRHAD